MKKKTILIIVGVIAVMGLIGAVIEKTSPATSTPQTKTNEKAVVQDTPTPVEQYDIKVTSQIVKKVGGKYRYFFSITNGSDKDFTGKVRIEGKTGAGITVISYRADFSDNPLPAGLSKSVFSDANTAPKQLYGENGASTYTFTATLNKNEVAKGEGTITEEYEDSGL